MTIDKDYHLNEWRKKRDEKCHRRIQKLVDENILLRTELNKSLKALAITPVVIKRDNEYYFISYAWRIRNDWEANKKLLKKGTITEQPRWNFAEECIRIHPFIWIDNRKTCCGSSNPTNSETALICWLKITREEYNIWLSTEHRNHF